VIATGEETSVALIAPGLHVTVYAVMAASAVARRRIEGDEAAPW
jgi:hypothetical protein